MTDPTLTDDQPHDEAEALLPWYATGQLDPHERARVERHLESCVHCQRQLAVERRLVDEFQTLTPEIDSGWARLRARLEPPRSATRARPKFVAVLGDLWTIFSRPAVATLAVAQLAFVVVAVGLLFSLSRTRYQALSAPAAPSSANIVVMFRPSSSEADLRRLLDASDASFVGGPTEADAYLLHVAADRRPRTIAALRADPHVTMAEPIDGGQQ
jgi:anti-sigma factor RsiW